MKKSLLIFLLLFFSAACFADAQSQSASIPSKSYKEESASSHASGSLPVEVYKGDAEEAVIAPEAKYSGQVYTSGLYQGALQASDYSVYFDRSLHDGFYIGAEAGYDFYKIRNSIDISFPSFQQNPDLSSVGMSYTLLGGYGKYFDSPLYIGIEFFYNYSQANSTNNVGGGGSDFYIDYLVKSVILGTYGASLTPGIKLSDSTLFYLKGGYTRVDMKTYETSNAAGVNNGQSNGVNGIHFGLGFEADIYRNWSIRGEYTHTNNRNFKTKTGTTVTPTNNQVMLGLLVHLA